MFAKSTEERFQRDTSVCTFNLLSSCTKGRKCPFLHDIPNNIGRESTGRKDPCYFFLKGRCNDGDSCQRSHSEPPSFNGTIKKVCLYFSQSRCDRGKLCSYSHDLPLNRSPVSIIVDSQSSSCQSKNINVVSPVVINTSDDDQYTAVTPKLCRYYRRGMCFFGENCSNFHDKPEKDPEDFISDLRENEVLKEKNVLHKIDSLVKSRIDSNDLSVVLTKNQEIDFNALKVADGCSNLSHQRKSRKVINSSSKTEDKKRKTNGKQFFKNSYSSSRPMKLSSEVPFDCSSKLNELFTVSTCHHSAKSAKMRENLCSSATSADLAKDPCRSANPAKMSEDLYNSVKSADVVKDPCSSAKSVVPQNPKEPSTFVESAELTKSLYNSSESVEFSEDPCSSSNSTEFFKASNNFSNSKKISKLTYNSTKSKESFRGLKTSSKPKEFVKGTYIFSKSKEFTRDTYSSDSKKFTRDSHDFSKSKEYSKSRYTCSYSQSKKFSNVSFSYTKSKKIFTPQYSSKPGGLSSSRYADILTYVEQFKNANVSMKSEEFTRNSERLKEQSENSNYPIKSEQFINVVDSISPVEQSKIANDLRPIKTKESFNTTNNPSNSNEQSNAASSNSTSKTQFTVTGGFNKHTSEPEMNCHMTRKQSKSRRKLKSENTHRSRTFYKRLFFKTPVPVTHVY